jgi:hypothetical protein
MNHERQLRDIYIRLGSEWISISSQSSSEEFKQYAVAYTQYKNRPSYPREIPYEANGGVTVCRYNNDHYKPTYVSHETGQNIPIIDMADVKVFLTDVPNANWFKARDYQAWAYRDFMFDVTEPQVKYYASRHSSHLFFQTSNYRDVVTIELDGLSPNIIFKISRNENGSVYYEKNDPRASRVRICDCEAARSGFLGFYRRITDVGDFIITPAPAPVIAAPPTHAHDAYGPEYQDFAGYLHEISATAAAVASVYQNHAIKLPLAPGTHSIQTDNEEEQCIMCFKNKSTLRLYPCGHKVMCPDCYDKMEKGECPICRGDIVKLMCENL